MPLGPHCTITSPSAESSPNRVPGYIAGKYMYVCMYVCVGISYLLCTAAAAVGSTSILITISVSILFLLSRSEKFKAKVAN